MTAVGVVTVARSDYGIVRPVLRRLAAHPRLEPVIYVAGAHLDERWGATVTEVERDGWPIAARVASAPEDDSPAAVARAAGRACAAFADALAPAPPGVLLVLGDRWDMHAAAVAALPLGVPVAHLHGGESSEGAIDESLRHSLTKLSHLHFAATELYARRIVRMGEEPWRVTVTGAPGVDALLEASPPPRAELERRVGIPLDRPTLLVTLHPATVGGDAAGDARELAAAIEESGFAAVATFPGADAGAGAILAELEALAARSDRVALVPHLGTDAYVGLMRDAVAMVGNSSSGIIEAATLGLPVVNVGDRQRGRVRGANVVDVPPERGAILDAVAQVTAPAFRTSLAGLENPYGDGHAAERVVERLAELPAREVLLAKRFYDGDEA